MKITGYFSNYMVGGEAYMLNVALTNHRHKLGCTNAWYLVWTISNNRKLKGYKTPFRGWNTQEKVVCTSGGN